MHNYKTQVLLLHSRQSTLDRFCASLADTYSVHMATSGTEALHTLGLTPIHVMVSAQKLPGMSGIEALREARKRSPETLGILIAPEDMSGSEFEALVGRDEVFQVLRGVTTPEEMRRVVDEAVDRLRVTALQESANDQSAGLTPRLAPTAPAAPPRPVRSPAPPPGPGSGQAAPAAADERGTEVVVLSKDDVFVDTVRRSLSPRQKVRAVENLREAAERIGASRSAVLVTDAAVAPRDVEAITTRLRARQPGLVTIVAGRRDDGDQLMDLINGGMVYRFLLKPISPGRARLAIEAAIRRAEEAATPSARTAPAPTRERPVAEPDGRIAPTLEDFEGAEEVVLSEEPPAAAVAVPAAERGRAAGGRRAQAPRQKPMAFPDEPFPSSKRYGWIAAAAAALIFAGGIYWYAADTPDADGQAPDRGDTPAPTAQPDAAAELPVDTPAPPPLDPDLLAARAAVAEGRLLAPGEDGALFLYARAIAGEPDNAALREEALRALDDAQAALARALDEGRIDQAQAVRRVIAAAFPDSPRLAGFDVRLVAIERERLLSAARERAASGDTEAALAALDEAAALTRGRDAAVESLREELLAASDTRGRTLLLELGNQRLLQEALVEPAADNARYYYRAVLSQDGESIAGRQGMAFLRSALIDRIRAAVEAGDRRTAERWLEEARLTGVDQTRLAPFGEAVARLPEPGPEPAPASSAPVQRLAEPAGEPAGEETAGEAAAPAAEPAAEALRDADGTISDTTPDAAPTDAIDAAAEDTADISNDDVDGAANAAAGTPTDAEASAAGIAADDAGPVGAATDATPAATPEQPAGADVPDDTAATTGAGYAATADEAVPASAAASGETAVVPGVLQEDAPSSAGDGSPEPIAAAPGQDGSSPAPAPDATPPPERIEYRAPQFPRGAAARGIEGWVDVEFLLTPDGETTELAVVAADPPGIFEEAALEAVAEWRYGPPAESGWPPGEPIRIRINFGVDR